MPWNYFIPNINMIKFDGNYHVEWIFLIEQFFQTIMKQLRNQAIMEYLIKWKNLPIEVLAMRFSPRFHVDGEKIPSQQRGSLPIPQVPIRLTNVWCGRLDGIMDPLPF